MLAGRKLMMRFARSASAATPHGRPIVHTTPMVLAVIGLSSPSREDPGSTSRSQTFAAFAIPTAQNQSHLPSLLRASACPPAAEFATPTPPHRFLPATHLHRPNNIPSHASSHSHAHNFTTLGPSVLHRIHGRRSAGAKPAVPPVSKQFYLLLASLPS